MVAEIVISANFSDLSSRILAGSSEDNLAETPLVVSDVSDLGPTVQAARSGVVVPPGDSQALAEALDTLRAPALRAALATAGRRHVEAHFDLAACTRRFVEHLDALHVRQSEGADV